jgi:hypothetical protein
VPGGEDDLRDGAPDESGSNDSNAHGVFLCQVGSHYDDSCPDADKLHSVTYFR